MSETTEPRKLSQAKISTWLLNKLKPEHFKLAGDSRQVRHLCQQRRAVLMELKNYSNSDGSSITVGVPSIAAALDVEQRTVFRRLDDLRELGFLVDDSRVAFDKPMRRHIDLARVAQLLGIPTAPRPDNLPACISTELWHEFLPCIQDDVNYILDCITHYYHFDSKERVDFLLVECLRHSVRCGFVTEDLRSILQVDCDVKGCPGHYEPEPVFRDANGQTLTERLAEYDAPPS